MRLEGHLLTRIQLIDDKSTSLIKAISCVRVTDMHQFRGQPFIPLHQSYESSNVRTAHEKSQEP